MSEAQQTTAGPTGEANSEYDWVNKEVAAEVLKQAQAMIAAQHASVDGVNTKLTTALNQAVQLATITFGAAPLPLAEQAWMPVWAGIGLAAAGVCAAGASFFAWQGLRLYNWAAPGLSPEKTALPSVLKAQPQTAMMIMAWTYQDGIEKNRERAVDLNHILGEARTLLAVTPVVGFVTAVIAWYLLGDR